MISFLNLSKGILLTLLFGILLIEFPRDILDVYSALQVEKSVQYNVLTTVKIGPFTLFVYLILLNTFLSISKIKSLKFNGVNLILVLSLVFIGFISMFRVLLLNGSLHYPGLLITDLKFPIFLMSGIFQGGYLLRKDKMMELQGTLMIIPIVIGIRALLFILNDSLSNSLKLDLMTQPYLSLAILLVLIIRGDWGVYRNVIFRIFLILSLLNPSRGFFLLAALFISMALFWKFYKKVNFNLSFILQISFVGILIFGGLLIFNERLLNFFIWKLNVFQEFFNENVETSGSGKVRFIELTNIFELLSRNIYELFFGRGFGATYDFSYQSLDNVGVIDLKSYSQDQLDSGVYYTVHSFFSYTLLKYGIYGVIIYLFLPIRIFLSNINKNSYLLLAIFPFILIYLYYSRIEYMLLMGILLGSMRLKEKYV